MKKKAAAGAIDDLGLPEEPLLGPEEAAEAVREARRISGRPAPPPLAANQDDTPESKTEPEPLIPWGPLRPDEIPN